MKTKKFWALLAAPTMLFAFAGCSPEQPVEPLPDEGQQEELPLTAEYGIGDQSNLYGVCYLLEERSYTGSPFSVDDVATEVQLLKNLGAKTVRHWIHCTKQLSDKETPKREACDEMHVVLQECQKAGLINIGMNHHNFNSGVSSVGKLKRNLIRGGYVSWLEDYYTTWYTLVSEFPEVQYWEIDNELNNPDFMYNALDESEFTSEEMAEIATDMLWYASRGIHDANLNAITIMGGLTERWGLGNGDAAQGVPDNKWFLQAVYDNIASGQYGRFYGKQGEEESSLNPDDYFQIVSWHPYVWSKKINEDDFVKKNNAIYEVVLKNENKHKKVFITEVGCTDLTRGETVAAQYITTLFNAAKRMPYVETIDVFKMYDVATLAWGGDVNVDGGFSRYGLFYDPNPAREYYQIDDNSPLKTTDVKCTPGGPKKTAYAFQQAAGGSGDLTLLSKRLGY